MLKLITWNINSVRLRIEQATRVLIETGADVLCLQELKAATDKFPADAFAKIGYAHHVVRGQPGYNGVAFIAKRPLETLDALPFCGLDDARHAAVALEGDSGRRLTLHGVYTPAGGDQPDVETNEKFRHKLAFLDEMASRFGAPSDAVLMGDLNVAPLENDVWSHRQMIGVVSHTPIEVEKFERARAAGGWVDAVRRYHPEDQKLFSWWSYRAKDWRASNRGRRLDHVWASSNIARAVVSAKVLDAVRDWEKPSDHAPVVIELEL